MCPINFDSLPMDRPSNTLPDGFYRAKIEAATLKHSDNTGGNYISITYSLTDAKGKSRGKFWDNLFDTDKEIPRYKLGRFITALRLNIQGNFELKDLCKVIVGKELILALITDEKQTPPKNVLNVFQSEVFYPVAEWAALLGGEASTAVVEESVPDSDLPFDRDEVSADDAEDAAPTDFDSVDEDEL